MHGDGGGVGEQWAPACNQKVCGGRRIGRRRGENALGNCGATENRSEKSIRKYQLSRYYIGNAIQKGYRLGRYSLSRIIYIIYNIR